MESLEQPLAIPSVLGTDASKIRPVTLSIVEVYEMVKQFNFHHDWKLVRQLAWNYLPVAGFTFYLLWTMIESVSSRAGLRGLIVGILIISACIFLATRIESSNSFYIKRTRQLTFTDQQLTYDKFTVEHKLVKQLFVYRNEAGETLRLYFPISLATRPLILSGYSNLDEVLNHVLAHTDIPVVYKPHRTWAFWVGMLIIVSFLLANQFFQASDPSLLPISFQMALASLVIAITPQLPKLHKAVLIATNLLVAVGMLALAILMSSY